MTKFSVRSDVFVILCKMNFLTSIAAAIFCLSFPVQSYNILQESPSSTANVHVGRVSRYHEIDHSVRKWPDGIAYYTIDSSLAKFESEILRAIRHIEETTCIRFVTRTDESNFMSMRMVESGCYAPVGFQNSGPQDVLIYEPECGFYSYFLHQLIQSLGSIHEHQRSDRDEYITVKTVDLPESYLPYFEKMNESSHIRSDVYDFDSVMHYGSFRILTNQGGPAMLFNNGSLIPELQTKTQLSDLDIVGLNRLYECSNATRLLILATSNSLILAILCVINFYLSPD